MSYKITTKDFKTFQWADISQPSEESLNEIAKLYNLNYLQIVDSLQLGHLPKLEQSGEYDFLILRAFTAEPGKHITNINELSNKIAFFYNEKKLITIHRSPFDFLDQISDTLSCTEELLVYIISRMIETFVEPSEILANNIDNLEETIFLNNDKKISLEELYFHKSQTRITKKLLQITQQVVGRIEVKAELQPVLQDVKDKIFSLILNYDEVLDEANNLLNTYISFNAQRSNDVMKLLTIFSAFFLPLTFIVGIYGMNFDYMPELRWVNGYFVTIGIMAAIAIVIFLWFKRKKII